MFRVYSRITKPGISITGQLFFDTLQKHMQVYVHVGVCAYFSKAELKNDRCLFVMMSKHCVYVRTSSFRDLGALRYCGHCPWGGGGVEFATCAHFQLSMCTLRTLPIEHMHASR